jgi:transcriptional regulator with XRE-family HTH domain
VERGLSQETLADMAGIDRSYMSSIERGLRNISVLNMARIAGALGVPLGELVYGRKTLPFPVQTPVVDSHEEEIVEEDWQPGGYLSMG